MEKKDFFTITMSINEALDIIRDHCLDTEMPASGYKFKRWGNNIPADIGQDKEGIKMVFIKDQ